MKKIAVGILGATGIVGQQYINLLKNHPWFEVRFLASSEQSAGKSYAEAVKGRWHHPEPLSEELGKLSVHSMNDITQCSKDCLFVFSAVTSDVAKMYEERYAEAGIPVISNAAYHRKSPDVPVLIPEINHHHLEIIPLQQKNRGWSKGFIVVKPNCSIQSYMIPLAPLHEKYKVKKILAHTMQAVSGAGYPGVSSMNIHDNVIPFIDGEEAKSEMEPLKVWGSIKGNYIHDAQEMVLSVQCNRVSVLDGHMASVSVEFENRPAMSDILECWQAYKSYPEQLGLPSAASKAIIYRQEQDRPQPRLDRLAGNGMAISVGRLRECPLFHYRFSALSHNTIRGAAGGGILNAELLYKLGYL